MRVKRKLTFAQAWRWEPERETYLAPKWVTAGIVCGDIKPMQDDEAGRFLKVFCRGMVTTGLPGDWLVLEDGQLRILSEDQFNALYEEAGDDE